MNPGSQYAPEALIAVLIQLLLNARDQKAPSQRVIELLPKLLLQRAREVQGADPDGSLEININFPGYLTRTVNGVLVYVPFPLARAFPRATTLVELIALANKLSVGLDGCICISGSSAWLGEVPSIGDIDLCEYIFYGSTVLGRIMEQSREQDDTILAVMNCNGTKFTAPWKDCEAQLHRYIEQGPPVDTDNSYLKLDSCVFSIRLGNISASNIVLWLAPGRSESGSALRSFAHQEAVIDRGSGVARSLVEASRLGAYLHFLHEAMKSLIELYPIKALKRTLSLCSVLGLDLWYNELLGMLSHPVVRVVTDRKRLDDLDRLVESLTPDVKEELRRKLHRERTSVGADSVGLDDIAEVESIIRDVVRGATEEVEQWIERVAAANDAV